MKDRVGGRPARSTTQLCRRGILGAEVSAVLRSPKPQAANGRLSQVLRAMTDARLALLDATYRGQVNRHL